MLGSKFCLNSKIFDDKISTKLKLHKITNYKLCEQSFIFELQTNNYKLFIGGNLLPNKEETIRHKLQLDKQNTGRNTDRQEKIRKKYKIEKYLTYEDDI